MHRAILLLSIFMLLTGCGVHSMPRESPFMVRHAPATDPETSILASSTRVTFVGETDDQLATLETRSGKTLCDLPCVADVDDRTRLQIVLPVSHVASDVLEVPASFDGAPRGSRVTVEALPKKGSPGGSLGVLIPGAALSALGGFMAASGCPRKDEGDSIGPLAGCVLGVSILIPGVALFIAGAIWRANSRTPQLAVKEF